MKIPSELLTILKKTNPEIENIKMIDYNEVVHYDPMNFDKSYKFMVNVELEFNNTMPLKGDTDVYKEIINTTFKMVFHNHDNITFNIEKLKLPPARNYHSQEEFFNLFGIYQYESSDFRK
jgi:hypothetical protein